ncbi:translocation/assembly module TamB domain-containing protein [Albibacterium sp.]|uniref:translocation/assembly module TamB domain-containing protein n=1 Tax=Albibacterium sp. TaxID=2952885 RepID=UPI002C129775|nr:translocation/assembly module TamB domain-containing protein [Albibacterium sp.]HUH19477.1 translocation/assembly module TamB domain-containing protein [Albibacterium sp.]
MKRFTRISLKIVLWLLGSIIGLILLVFVLINIPAVQNFVVQKVVSYLETKIETQVDIKKISLKLPKLLVLEGVYFEDQSRDTLIAGDTLLVDISLLKLLNNKVEINELDFRGITANINRTLPDSAFNFDYIIRAFTSEQVEEESQDSTSAMAFSIDKINLDRIHLRYNDEIVGTDADFYLGHLDTRIKTFDLQNMAFEIPKLVINGIRTRVKQWEVATAEDIPSTDDLGVERAAGAEVGLPDLKLGDIELSNINVVYEDEASAINAQVKFNHMAVNFKNLDLKNEIIEINKITLKDSESKLLFEKPGSDNTSSEADTSQEESMNWVVSAATIDLKNTNVKYDDNATPKINKGLDYAHLDISNLNLDLKELYFSMDSIQGNLEQLNFKDQSGLEINKLETEFTYTDTGILLNDLFLETPNTVLNDYAEIGYPSLAALSEKPELMTLKVNLNNSTLGMKDIALLVPTLDTMEVMKPLLDKSFKIDGDLSGSLSDLNTSGLVVRTLNDTYLNLSGNIKNLMDPDNLFVNLNIVNLRTSNRDISRLVAKTMLPPDIDIPSSIQMKGKIKGDLNNISTNMVLNSSVGSASLVADYKAGRDTSYQAKINIQNLNVGSFLKNDTTFGKVNFSADLKGVGLDPKNMIAEGKAHLISAEVMGYTYRDINLDFKADKGDILANLTSVDSNLALTMDAQATWTEKYPALKMTINADSINLKNLKLTDDDIRYHGQLKADLATADPDYLNGDINIVNSLFSYNGDRYALDSISLSSEATDSLKIIGLESEFLNANIYGQYKLTQLSTAIQDVIRTYYNPTNITDTTTYDPQSFEFNAELTRSPLIQKIAPELIEMEPITLFGNFTSEERSINARIGASHILYEGTLIDGVSFDINTADSTLFYAGTIGEINISNIELINTLISGNVKDSKVDAGLWIKDSLDKEQYHLGAQMLAENDNFIFNLKPDGLILNYDQWDINPENSILFGDQGILAHHFILQNENQQLSLTSKDSVLNSPIDVQFSDFRIETFTKFIESSTFKLGGGINGEATIDRLESSPTFVSDITVNDFYFANDTIGDINLKVNNLQENTFATDITISGFGNDVNLKGDYISPPDQKSTMDFVLNMNQLNMSTLEAFSFGSIRRADGFINGQLAITGSPDAPRINGELLFNDAELNVSMLNADFILDNDAITFNDSGIQLSNFSISDSVGNHATIDGMVRTQTYTDFTFDLDLDADNFQVLNSTNKDNDLFYGQLFLNSDLRITGNMDSPQVNGSLKVNDNTKMSIVVPDDNPGITEREGIVEFVNKKDLDSEKLFAQRDSVLTKTVAGLDVSVNIDVDPDAEFTIIIDPGTGDALFIKGTAQLNAGIDPGGNISLSGTYEVEEGSYELSFNMLKRKFYFKKGSTITWNGEMMAADLNITAAYDINAAPIDLLENQLGGRNSNYYKQKIPFEVNLILTGEMLKPNIAFDINLQEENSGVSQDVTSLVNTRLSQVRENESELNKQVFALIVLGRFVAENPFASAAGGSVESMARNSVSQLLSAQLNNLAGDLIAGVELNFDLQSTDDYSTGSLQNRTDLNVGVSKRLLNDRLKVTVGSNFEIEGGGQPGRKPSNIAGDIAVEYQLSKDGRYFLRAFRKNDYEVTLQGQVIETGIGFNINMDYDKFKELFMNADKLQEYHKQIEERKRKELLKLSEPSNGKDNSGIIEFKEKGESND